MFCPKCATQNADNARFCRACGADISLVPQALSKSLPQQPAFDDGDVPVSGRRRRRRERGIEGGIKNIFVGTAFLLIALIGLTLGRQSWMLWMLIPAFAMIGGGIAEIVRFRMARSQSFNPFENQAQMPPAPQRATNLPPRNTAELYPQPPSVIEGTTRHLGAEAPTRHFDPQANQEQK